MPNNGESGVIKLWKKASVRGFNKPVETSIFMVPSWFFHGTKYAKRIGESTFFLCFMIVLALWSIFSDDIRLASTTRSADSSFEIVISIIFFMFLLEILLSCYYKEDYMLIPSSKRSKDGPTSTWKSVLKRLRFGSFYFWLDLIATFSLVAEV